MNVEELLTRLSLVAGLSLIISGLFLIALRRRLIAILLGFHLTVLGAAVVMCRPGAIANSWTAAILLAAAVAFVPMTLAAFAWRRHVSGDRGLTSLKADGQIDG